MLSERAPPDTVFAAFWASKSVFSKRKFQFCMTWTCGEVSGALSVWVESQFNTLSQKMSTTVLFTYMYT